MTFANGDKYLGNFKDNNFYGKGKLTTKTEDSADKLTKKGTFENGKIKDGIIKIEYKRVTHTYEGTMKDKKLNSTGTETYEWPDSRKYSYTGDFLNG